MDITAAPSLSQLTAIIAAVGALGTAAFGAPLTPSRCCPAAGFPVRVSVRTRSRS